MTARVYGVDHWFRARQHRARLGRAPRLAVQRGIYLRQFPDGRWAARIQERRFGVWRKPEWLCPACSLAEAQRAALAAWRRYKLPLVWAYAGERTIRAFHAGVNEPQAVSA